MVVAVIVIIVLYSMYRSAQAKALAAQQRLMYPTATTSQKINTADLGSFIGGLIGGATAAPATTTAGTGGYTQAELDYMASMGTTKL